MYYTLITGASTGIGKELAKVFAKAQYNLVLIARSIDKLESLKKELQEQYKIDIQILTIDLSKKDSAYKIYEYVKNKGIKVQILVNNAGFGTNGAFLENNLEKELEEIQVNVVSLIELTYYMGKEMLKDSQEKPKYFYKILNVGSIAGFQPGPFMNIYYSTKAFVLFFSEGLYEELKEKNILVSVLCPGPVKTDFFSTANIEKKLLTKLPMLDPEKLAHYTFKKLMKNKVIIIPGITNKIGVFSAKVLPRSIVRKITKIVNK